jgi:hypothetical protein
MSITASTLETPASGAVRRRDDLRVVPLHRPADGEGTGRGQCRQTHPRSVAPEAAVARQNRAPMGSCSASGCGQAGQPGSCAAAVSGSLSRWSVVSVVSVCGVYVGTVMAAA